MTTPVDRTSPSEREVTRPDGPEWQPMSRRRMIWLLMSRGDLLPFLPEPLAGAVLLVVAWLVGSPVLALVVAGAFVAGCLRLIWKLRTVRGLPITPATQPALAALVADTAARLGVPTPHRLWLTGDADAAALPLWLFRRRDEVCLGACTASALSDLELRAVVAHELAHLSDSTRLDRGRRRLVHRLLAERQLAAEQWEELSDRRRHRALGRGVERFLRQTQRLAHEEELRADAAALRVVDPDVAARALAREYAVGHRFAGFVLRCVAPLVEAGRVPSELHAGWVAWCATPVFWSEGYMAEAVLDANAIADEHPTLRERIAAYGATDPVPWSQVPHPDNVLRPLRPDEQAALSLRFVRRSGLTGRFRLRRLRPVRWAEVPEGFYASCDSWLREAMASAATEVLGRPADDLDVVELIVTGRRGDLQPALVSHLAERTRDSVGAEASAAIPDATLVAVMLYPALRSHGYRQLDPVAQHLLTGPDGEQFDLAATSARVLTDPVEFARLGAWLFPPDGANTER